MYHRKSKISYGNRQRDGVTKTEFYQRELGTSVVACTVEQVEKDGFLYTTVYDNTGKAVLKCTSPR